LAELIDGEKGLCGYSSQVTETLRCPGWQLISGGAVESGQVESHLPARHGGRRAVEIDLTPLGDPGLIDRHDVLLVD